MRVQFLVAVLALGLTSCTHYFYNPDRVLYYPPELTGYTQQDIDFQTSDGVRLHAWYFPSTAAGPSHGTVLHFHGNSRNISSMYMNLAWLTASGYGLLCFDYRGYGESGGSPSEEGTYKDALAALELAWQLHGKNDPASSKFVVYAHSLGGVIAARALADFPHQDAVSLLVLDSTFMSYRDMAQGMLARRWLTWPISPFARILISDDYASKPVIPLLKMPILIAHDRHDPLVPFTQGEEIFNAVVGAKEKFFWEKDRGVHAGIFSREGNHARFLELLNEL